MKHRKERISASEDSDLNNRSRYSNGLVDDNSASERDSSPPPQRVEKSSKKKSPKRPTTDDIVDDCLEKFKRDHPDLKKFKMIDCMSDSDDEISIVELPNNIDPELLLDKRVRFQGKTKLKINRVKYVVKPCQDIEEPLLLLTNKKRFIRPIARLKLQEYVKDKQKNIEIDTSASESTSQNRLLPEKLKNRHPIFGSDYQKKIELDDETKNRLNFTEVDDEKPKKKKKKKRTEEVDEHDGGDREDREELIFKLLRESVNDIMPEKKNKKIKQEIVDSSDSSDVKKTKKRKIETDRGTINGIERKESLIQKLVLDRSRLIGADPSILEKRKKKLKSEKYANSTVVPNDNPDFEIDVSRIDPLEKSTKKKKKIKQEIVEDNVEITSPSPPPPVKKSKKIKKEPIEIENSLISDLLNNVKSELNPSKQKKKV